MIRLRCILLIFFITTGFLTAQPYEHAVGIKAGYSSGVVYKLFLDKNGVLDGQALYNSHGFQFTALYAYQFTPYAKKRLFYFAGVGPHGGNWDEEFALGVALNLGAEFVFRKAPLVMGLEWKPMVNLYKVSGYAIPDIGIAVKVVLN
ncbi:MAG: hypothetical protein WD577_14060 [Bacteroidales bacterium]